MKPDEKSQRCTTWIESHVSDKVTYDNHPLTLKLAYNPFYALY